MISLYSLVVAWPWSDLSVEIEAINAQSGQDINVPIRFVKEAIEAKEPPSEAGIIALTDDEIQGFFPIVFRENTEYLCSIRVPGTVEELAKVHLHDKSWPFLSHKVAAAFSRNPPRHWITHKDGLVEVTGRLNFRSHVGVADLSIGESERFLVEVASSKTNYLTDFWVLLDEVSSILVDLIFSYGAVTGTFLDESAEKPLEESSVLFILRHLFARDRLPTAMTAIFRRPHSVLGSSITLTDLGLVTCPDVEECVLRGGALPYQNGGKLRERFGGYTPLKLPEAVHTETYDTVENRYVKNFLGSTLYSCQTLLSIVTNRTSDQTRDDSVAQTALRLELLDWVSSLEEWMSHPMWENVSPMTFLPTNSQVLQRRAGYREILEYEIKLRVGLSLAAHDTTSINSIDGDIRPIFDLYEIWCFLKLREVLIELFGEATNEVDLFRFEKEGLAVNLRRGTNSKIVFATIIESLRVEVALYYNRRFNHSRSDTGSYSIAFQPDFTLQVRLGNGSNGLAYVHFDAKYGLDQFDESAGNDDTEEQVTTAKRSDLVKMHAYKDAIRWSGGSFVLYPGSELKYYGTVENELLPGIGAFPLRPSSSREDQTRLSEFINTMLEQMIIDHKAKNRPKLYVAES